jgi:hypothetical protein
MLGEIPMEHPWLLVGSAVASSPLIWRTFQFFFPNFREDLHEDGGREKGISPILARPFDKLREALGIVER